MCGAIPFFEYTTGVSELPRYENMNIIKKKTSRARQVAGVTLIEYLIVVVALALLFLTYYSQFAPKSSAFYSDIVDGLNNLYPRGYYQPAS
jgi:Flp pilus assembly pilin Flp